MTTTEERTATGTWSGQVVLLGPQRNRPTVREALAPRLANDGPVAAITAGWEEREAEDLELGEHLSRDVLNLQLHKRALAVFEEDPDLLTALQERHDVLTELQQLYRLHLRHLVPAAEKLLRRKGRVELIEPEREAAFTNLRALDAHHFERVQRIHDESAAELELDSRPSVKRHREEIAELLGRVGALCIAGGHVGILYNRLWMFDLRGLLPDGLPIIAWSAGAMAIADRIVLFHDSPPQGPGNAEVLSAGLGLFKGVLPLPHARSRLKLTDHIRVQLMSRRFQERCVVLEDGTAITFDGNGWTAGEATSQLQGDGSVSMFTGREGR